jgi:hypothetical protein
LSCKLLVALGIGGAQRGGFFQKLGGGPLLVAEFSLSMRVRMTMRGWEFSSFFLKHNTMPYPLVGLGIHIYRRLLASQVQDAV